MEPAQKRTVCIVDDDRLSLAIAKKALAKDYSVIAVESALEMFSLLEAATPDLIILDLVMPKMNGFEALERLKAQEKYCGIPVIIISSLPDTETRWLELGAVDFIGKPYKESVLLHRCKTHIGIDAIIRERTQKIEQLQNSIICVMANMVESRDATTGRHIERTTAFFRIMLESMLKNGVYSQDIIQWDINVVASSARLHDIGKIAISDAILNKPGTLTDSEFAVMKTHTLKGEEIIDLILTQNDGNELLYHAKCFTGAHHEKWDGSGYPRGLKGERIPLEARILAPADVYDALTSDRPYRGRMRHEDAVDIIAAGRGAHFDPKVIDVFLRVQNTLKGM